MWFILLLVFLVFTVSAQAVDPRLLDLSKAKASIAGPDRVYVRSIYYEGESLSVLFVYNGTDGATVYGPYFAGDKYLQDEYELGYVKFRKEGDAKLALTDIVLNENLAYSGRVHWDGSDVLRLLSFWESSQPTTREDEIANLHKKVADLEARSPEKVVEERVVERVVEKAVPERVEELPSRFVHSGFSGGRALFGKLATHYP